MSRLSNRSEEAEQAAQRATREAEEESASLKAALSDEFAQARLLLLVVVALVRKLKEVTTCKHRWQ